MAVSDINNIKSSLQHTAIHAYNLAIGLQNAAPTQSLAGASVQYLKEISLKLEDILDQFTKEKTYHQLIELIRGIIEIDQTLREKYQIETKFRFVHEELQRVLAHAEKIFLTAQQAKKEKQYIIASDETLIYVYLYNANGMQFRSWQNMIMPKVFYEYSVNRPIYTEKAYVENLLKTKNNKLQHGYLTIAVNNNAIISDLGLKDSLGHPVIKVKEGSLHFDRLFMFTHNDHDYKVGESGELIKLNPNK